MFLQIVPSYNNFHSRPKNPEVCIFHKILEFLFEIRFFSYIEDIDLGSPKLHTIEIFSQTTFHKKLVNLASIAAELAAAGGGQILPPPSRVRNSEPHSRSRANTLNNDHF